MLTLYFCPGACSTASHMALEETGAQYGEKPIFLPKGEQKTETYLKINPRGKVPAHSRHRLGIGLRALQQVSGYVADRLGGGDSDRQWGDILGVLRLNAGKLDHELLRSSASELGVADLLEKALAA